jgi:pimeloyl-ACP methyl ester carboxylesterase
VSGDGHCVRPHRLAIDRAVIHCRERGSGDAVILLPAGGCRSDYLDPLAEALATACWRVIAVDLRGAGDSHGPAEDSVTLHTLAADVAAVIARLDAAPAHIIGHAFGNRVARCLAHDRPDFVRSLVLLACGGQVPPDATTQEAARQLVRDDIDPAVWSAALRAVYLAPGSDPALVEALGQTPAATRAQAAAHKATTDQDWQAGGTAPMLVLQGLADRMAPATNGHVLRDRYGARVQVIDIEGAGHLLPLEQPAPVRDHILAFLSRAGGPSR